MFISYPWFSEHQKTTTEYLQDGKYNKSIQIHDLTQRGESGGKMTSVFVGSAIVWNHFWATVK